MNILWKFSRIKKLLSIDSFRRDLQKIFLSDPNSRFIFIEFYFWLGFCSICYYRFPGRFFRLFVSNGDFQLCWYIYGRSSAAIFIRLWLVERNPIIPGLSKMILYLRSLTCRLIEKFTFRRLNARCTSLVPKGPFQPKAFSFIPSISLLRQNRFFKNSFLA